MFDNAVLAGADMAVAPHHDGRHALPATALGRESIPYIVVLPEHGIAFFTYTWVSADSTAGAAFALFGPGVGDAPIQQRIADRPVPRDMDFDNWVIDGFSMKQDLEFGKAQVRWETPEATVEFAFEAFHPPYSYGNDARPTAPPTASSRPAGSRARFGSAIARSHSMRPATATTAGARATGFPSSSTNGSSARSAARSRSTSGTSMRWGRSMSAATSTRTG
jgi:hypothetical protein